MTAVGAFEVFLQLNVGVGGVILGHGIAARVTIIEGDVHARFLREETPQVDRGGDVVLGEVVNAALVDVLLDTSEACGTGSSGHGNGSQIGQTGRHARIGSPSALFVELGKP